MSDYKIGDIVLIDYWYKDITTPVKITKKTNVGYIVSHNTPASKLQGAPNEELPFSRIIGKTNLA